MRMLLVALAAIQIVTFQASPAQASEEFRFEYFPHVDENVEFHNDWGAGRSGGRRHQGTDVFSDKMTPVVAVADGFVERVHKGPRSGYYVWIRHSDGYSTWYMHLNNDTPGTDDGRGGDEFAIAEGVEKGAFVRAGQTIAWVGDSGNAEPTRSHTHFELHFNGRPINPYHFLADVWERELRLTELHQTLK